MAPGLFPTSSAELSPRELLLAADAARHVVDEGIISVRALVRGRDGSSDASKLDVFVKGADRTLCVFREGKQQGREVLVLGDRVWLIVPGSKHPIAVSASQRLLGAASVADLAKMRLADEFDATMRDVADSVGNARCWVLDLRAKNAKAPYATGVLWIGQGDRLPRRLLLSLRSGKVAKELLFTAFRSDGGRTVLAQLEIRHLLTRERVESTILDFLRYQPASIDPAMFSPTARVRE